jgi:hypothetical protein
MKRAGRVWIRVFPGRAGVEEAARSAHGLGKGGVEYWVTRVKPGRILFELDGVPVQVAKEASDWRPPSFRSRRALCSALPVREESDESRRRQGTDARPAFDELMKLKKEQFNLRFQRRRASWRKPAACARCAATSRASKPIAARSAQAEKRSEERLDAEADAAVAPW